MAGIFPESGAPAGPNTPGSQTGITTNSAETCPPLFHQGICIPRFDPPSANAVISEVANVINDAGRPYDCSTLHNLSLGVQYFIQRGKPQGVSAMQVTTGVYTGVMTPASVGYTDFQNVTFVPDSNNVGPFTLNLDGNGPVNVLLNNGTAPKAGDAKAGIPVILSYKGGAFYYIGVAPSQVPQVMTSNQTYWVRTDGSDLNDGSANTPSKAFATIQGAWNAIGSRFAPSPFYTITIRLGNPGTYTGTVLIENYSGKVLIRGDGTNPGDYFITRPNSSPGASGSSTMGFTASNVTVAYVTVLISDTVAPTTFAISSTGGNSLELDTVTLAATSSAGNIGGGVIMYGADSLMLTRTVIMDMQGRVANGSMITAVAGGTIQVGPDTLTLSTLSFRNIANGSVGLVGIQDQSRFNIAQNSNVTSVSIPADIPSSAAVMSIVRLSGVTMPGAGFTVDASSILIP